MTIKEGFPSISRFEKSYFKSEYYRRIWQQIQEKFNADEASRLMVESLYLAAKLDKEMAIAYWLIKQLKDETLTLSRLQQQFSCPPGTHWETSVVEQHSRSDYDRLLHDEFSQQRSRDFTNPYKLI